MSSVQKSKILIVEDTDLNIDILVEALGQEYDISVAMDGETALVVAPANPPDIILLDVMMPGMDGYEVCARLKADPVTADIPVIFLTAMTDIADKARGFEMGAVDYIIKPFAIAEVTARVDVHLSLLQARRELKQQNALLEIKVDERTRELSLTRRVIIEAMASLAESRDSETGDHVLRTKYYVQALANRLRNHPRFSDFLQTVRPEELGQSAILHDVGKVGVRDHILLKPGKLTPEEFEEMKKHAVYGYEIISKARKRLGKNSFLLLAEQIAWCHHEKWNGSGYPRGLVGDEIPIPARLMAVADVYDAIISRRVYKEAMGHDMAVNIIIEGKGQHFDPCVVDAFMDLRETFMKIASELAPGQALLHDVFSEHDELGVILGLGDST